MKLAAYRSVWLWSSARCPIARGSLWAPGIARGRRPPTQQARPPDRAVAARRRRRRALAHAEPEALGSARPANHHRQPRRRRGQHRRGDGGKSAARRLHDRIRVFRHARRQSEHLRQDAVQGKRFRADHLARGGAAGAGRASVAAGEKREGPDRARESEARPAFLRLERQRRDQPSRGRAFQLHGGDEDRARAVQRRRPGRRGADQRRDRDDIRRARVVRAVHQIGQGARRRRDEREGARSSCRSCRRSPNRACRDTK